MPKGKYPRKFHYPLNPTLPIDDTETLKRLGYAATTVSPGSTKKVSCRCMRCGVVFDRMRRRVTPDVICASCAHTKGEAPAEFPRGSGYEKVWTVCSICKEPLKARRMSVHSKIKCPRCKRLEAPKTNIYIDAKETMRRFGYDTVTMSAKSFKRVVVRCVSCQRLFERIRRNVTSQPVCTACVWGNPPKSHAYIDDVQTQTRFGYTSAALSRKSNRYVVVRCSSCGASFEQRRVNVSEQPQCSSCRYPRVNHTCVDSVETKKRFGYDVTTLTRTSSKLVVVQCVECGDLFERRMVSVTDQPKCRTCQFPVKPHVALDDVATEQRFGYKASEVPSRSARFVVGHCVTCGAQFERARHNVSDAPVCRPCTYFVPPMNNCYGRTENTLREQLEVLIGRKVNTQWRLPTGQFVDIYDPQTKVGIEYNGLYWHHEQSPTPRTRLYHRNKQLACAVQDIDLITIFEDEWKSRQAAVLNVLTSRLGVYTERIGARQCQLRSVQATEANVFLEKHHVQGAPAQHWAAWGLYDVKELVAVITVGPHHRQGHAITAVLSRLCYASGICIVGGAKRLLKPVIAFAKERACTQLISWSDNRWFTGQVYPHLGFSLTQILPPDYTYVSLTRPRERLSKQSQQKRRTNCPIGMTEHEWALQRGLARIWDCGHRRWTMPL